MATEPLSKAKKNFGSTFGDRPIVKEIKRGTPSKPSEPKENKTRPPYKDRKDKRTPREKFEGFIKDKPSVKKVIEIANKPKGPHVFLAKNRDVRHSTDVLIITYEDKHGQSHTVEVQAMYYEQKRKVFLLYSNFQSILEQK